MLTCSVVLLYFQLSQYVTLHIVSLFRRYSHYFVVIMSGLILSTLFCLLALLCPKAPWVILRLGTGQIQVHSGLSLIRSDFCILKTDTLKFLGLILQTFLNIYSN